MRPQALRTSDSLVSGTLASVGVPLTYARPLMDRAMEGRGLKGTSPQLVTGHWHRLCGGVVPVDRPGGKLLRESLVFPCTLIGLAVTYSYT